jgi:hypothetical protein
VCLVLNQRGTCKGQTEDDLNKLLASPNGEIIESSASALGKREKIELSPASAGRHYHPVFPKQGVVFLLKRHLAMMFFLFAMERQSRQQFLVIEA